MVAVISYLVRITSNLILDYRTIQAPRYNGSSALMKLNPFGGNVDIGSTTTSGVNLIFMVK